MLSARSTAQARPASRRSSVAVRAATWTKVSTKDALKAAGGKTVVDVNGSKILLAELDGAVYAVSNKCSHLGLPLVGKTAMFQGQIKEQCIVCPAHGTAFDLKTGAVKGEWCPSLPNLPLIGKGPAQKPLPTYESRVGETGDIEVLA